MLVIVPTAGNPERMRAHRWLPAVPGARVVLVAATPTQAEQAARTARADGVAVVAPPARPESASELSRPRAGAVVVAPPTAPPAHLPRAGIAAWNRAWAEKHLVEDGQWYAMVDDNAECITALPEHLHNVEDLRESDFETPLTPYGVGFLWRELVEKCEEVGTIYGGTSRFSNPFYRRNRWQKVGQVIASHCVCKKSPNLLPWNYLGALEDVMRSCDVVTRYGSIVVDRWARVVKPHGEAGGLGSAEQRFEANDAAHKALDVLWPGLVRVKTEYPKHSVQFRVRNIERWRNATSYDGPRTQDYESSLA